MDGDGNIFNTLGDLIISGVGLEGKDVTYGLYQNPLNMVTSKAGILPRTARSLPMPRTIRTACAADLWHTLRAHL